MSQPRKPKPPVQVGARVAYMPNGYSLVPAVVVSLQQGSSGSWRGDIRIEGAVLENRSLHPDYFLKESALQEINRVAWGPIWERLEKEET